MPRKTDSGNPYDWLEYAGLDLEAVMLLARQKAVFPVCKSKLAEALEKAMKADLLTRGWALEKIHDLQKLNDYLSEYDEIISGELQQLVDDLADCYIADRYPGFDLEDPDWPAVEALLKGVSEYIDRLRKGGLNCSL